MSVGIVRSLPGRNSTNNNWVVGPKVLLCILGLVAFASAQPASFLLDTSCVAGRDYSTCWATGSACGDSLGLVAWAGGGVPGIEGCRVRRDMSVVDSICLDISGPDYLASPDNQHAVDVAWSGQNWLVVWLTNTELCVSLVSPQGAVTSRAVVCAQMCKWVSVASDGDRFLVTWEQNDGEFTHEMYRLVSGDGTPLDSASLVSQLGGVQTEGDAEFADSCYMVVFCRGDAQGNNVGLSAVRIRPDGTLLDTIPIPIREGAWSVAPTVERMAGNFYAAWGEGVDSTCIRMTRVTPGGVVLDTGGVAVGRDSMIEELSSTALGDTCLLAWLAYARDSGFLRAIRVNRSVHPLDSVGLRVGSASWAQAPPGEINALAASDFAVIWCQLQVPLNKLVNRRNVVCRRVSSSGALIDSTDRALSCAANTQMGNGLTSDGHGFLAVWQDWSGLPLSSGLRMARFTSDGTLLDTVGVPAGDSWAFSAAVAYGPDYYLLCWAQCTSCRIEAMRVGRDGVVLDTLPILVSQCPSLPGHVDVAYGDSMFLVVWDRGGSGVFGVRVRADGIVLDSIPKPMAHGMHFSFLPRVASDGHSFLVTHNGDYQQLCAARVDSAGHLMDTADIYLGDMPGEAWSAPVVYGAGSYLAYDWGGSRAWRISRNGEMLTSLRGLGLDPASTVSFDGTDFLISGSWNRAIGEQRISPSGVVLDPLPNVLATIDPVTSLLNTYDGCASDTNGNTGLMFTSYERPRYMSFRVRAAACPAPAIGETKSTGPTLAKRPPTVIRGMLYMPPASAVEREASYVLLDISGRKVLNLRSGANDVHALALGVYFVREEPQAPSGKPKSVSKIVIVR